MDLPRFPYHPDPIATGSVVASDAVCQACGQARGYIYTGPVYAEEDLDDAFCPWCIADGTTQARFDAEFTDVAGIGGYGAWEKVPDAVREEVAYRTPGFNGWQSERWFTHCGDAAALLAIVGRKELDTFGPEAVEAIRIESGYTGAGWEAYYAALDRDHGPTAYIFRCRHCGLLGGYSDCH
jgi:uncharacterized protein